MKKLEREFHSRYGRPGMWRERGCSFGAFLACFDRDFVLRTEQGWKARLGETGLEWDDQEEVPGLALIQKLDKGFEEKKEKVLGFGEGRISSADWSAEKVRIAKIARAEHKFLFGDRDSASEEGGDTTTTRIPAGGDTTVRTGGGTTATTGGGHGTGEGTRGDSPPVVLQQTRFSDETGGGARSPTGGAATGSTTLTSSLKKLSTKTLSTVASSNNTRNRSTTLPPLGSTTSLDGESPRREGGGRTPRGPGGGEFFEDPTLNAFVKAPKNSGAPLTAIERVMTNLARIAKPELVL